MVKDLDLLSEKDVLRSMQRYDFLNFSCGLLLKIKWSQAIDRIKIYLLNKAVRKFL